MSTTCGRTLLARNLSQKIPDIRGADLAGSAIVGGYTGVVVGFVDSFFL